MGNLIRILIRVAGNNQGRNYQVIFVSYYLQKFLKLHVSQTKKLSLFLLVAVTISSQGLVSTLSMIVSPQCLKSLFSVHSRRSLSYSKNGKLPKMTTRCHLLSFVVTCCHSLSLFVSRSTTRSHSLYHSLPFVVTRCTSRYHLFSLDLSLAYLFVNDFELCNKLGK